eukprot:CAMPEP_0204595826 /NCGR_PEP_ID=MMETSP0661-20131031/52892_1 /ASSEMBLY_ACC=CAM_ASM_000606 /TAXON_ID=109239 /ORGANISM="Alexandrium margalefi, Strain AMGDE01CS-322" /LENGTH=124 /DNA_ID=CAMNT_0051606387 /DNA_START=186 /DNA_END=559 /DNA_ORIENTATION=-
MSSGWAMQTPHPALVAPVVEGSLPAWLPVQVAIAAGLQELSTGVGSLLTDFVLNLRPRKFAVRLDVQMKKGSSPYPRNPNRKKPVPKVKGIKGSSSIEAAGAWLVTLCLRPDRRPLRTGPERGG